MEIRPGIVLCTIGPWEGKESQGTPRDRHLSGENLAGRSSALPKYKVQNYSNTKVQITKILNTGEREIHTPCRVHLRPVGKPHILG